MAEVKPMPQSKLPTPATRSKLMPPGTMPVPKRPRQTSPDVPQFNLDESQIQVRTVSGPRYPLYLSVILSLLLFICYRKVIVFYQGKFLTTVCAGFFL